MKIIHIYFIAKSGLGLSKNYFRGSLVRADFTGDGYLFSFILRGIGEISGRRRENNRAERTTLVTLAIIKKSGAFA